MIDGIKCIQEEKAYIFLIYSFSNNLKEKIRNQLSFICHGSADGKSDRIAYNYKNTLEEFFKRFNTKTDNQKKGMIGELITHILLLSYFEMFDTISPFFNTEERNIKKGFDIVLYDANNTEIWITEVKSGYVQNGKNANESAKDLLGIAKRDLRDRLSDNNFSLWNNAITGAKKSIEDCSNIRQVVLNILKNIQDEIAEKPAISQNRNVILVSNLFHKIEDSINISTAKSFSSELSIQKIFKDHFVVCIQKATLEKIINFLQSEL